MIEFRQKCFSEFDAMRSLWVQIQRDFNWRNKIKRIDRTSLAPILTGNNVVIERFVISKTFFGKDRYRMYLKLGAKVKLPKEGVRLPGRDVTKKLGGLQISAEASAMKPWFGGDNNQQQGGGDNQKKDKKFSTTSDNNSERRKLFSNNNNNGPKPLIYASYKPYIDIQKDTTVTPDTLKYSMKERSLVLEFDSIRAALEALDVLPFGLDYNLYIVG